jgi:hypothetical protein
LVLSGALVQNGSVIGNRTSVKRDRLLATRGGTDLAQR